MIKPKIAYIEFNDSNLEDFYEEWENNEDTEPTQEDYDDWLIQRVVVFFENFKGCYDNYVKLREKND